MLVSALLSSALLGGHALALFSSNPTIQDVPNSYKKNVLEPLKKGGFFLEVDAQSTANGQQLVKDGVDKKQITLTNPKGLWRLRPDRVSWRTSTSKLDLHQAIAPNVPEEYENHFNIIYDDNALLPKSSRDFQPLILMKSLCRMLALDAGKESLILIHDSSADANDNTGYDSPGWRNDDGWKGACARLKPEVRTEFEKSPHGGRYYKIWMKHPTPNFLGHIDLGDD